MSVETRVVEQKGLKAVDVAIVAVLLAVGAVLRYFTPPIAGITPNFVIIMYCLSILLIRPKFGAILGIGLVSAAICQVTTKSLFPYLNFVSEPVGAIVVGLLAMIRMESGFLKYVRPFLITLLGTLVSGFTYISIFKAITLFVQLGPNRPNPAYAALVVVVLVTAVANTVLGGILYFPLKAALGKK
ncbi:hypothetical protein EDC14_102949 [Hydrogenispora ethanolica]|jgi:hypothetical protein|uniref:ECF transporter S component n=1 Tax=Hydrogenispora ethanolica TaxID=1082276 RepID=A0A4R1R8Y6_HYDET|nr:tryptophan transporter [Hydrogenispora ethanolica]TCL62020.1 hypothetical protein EDC14_102949 [Hydrogenispora ethanolica]